MFHNNKNYQIEIHQGVTLDYKKKIQIYNVNKIFER